MTSAERFEIRSENYESDLINKITKSRIHPQSTQHAQIISLCDSAKSKKQKEESQSNPNLNNNQLNNVSQDKYQPARQNSTQTSINSAKSFRLLLYVADKNTHIKFLIDSGAEVSLIPLPLAGEFKKENVEITLYAPNGSTIDVYGHKYTEIKIDDFNYRSKIIVENVTQPILGLDFLNEHKISISIHNKMIHSERYNVSNKCINVVQTKEVTSEEPIQEIKDLIEKYHALFSESDNQVRRSTNTSIKHHIILDTTAPINSRQYYLAQELNIEVRKHFEQLEKDGIVTRSKSPYSSPITVIKKPNNKLRIRVK